MNVKFKQKVMRTPETFFDGDLKEGKANRHPMPCIVIYIHPRGRFHVVEFNTPGGPIREAFLGVAV